VAHFLGEKCPTFDYLVELVDSGPRQLFFFVQVKATREGYTKKHKLQRLKVRVTADDVQKMARYPAPTYVVGVDERDERAFIVCVYGNMASGFSSMTTAHELKCSTLRRLWNEVRNYWRNRNIRRKTSLFPTIRCGYDERFQRMVCR
jgi:hypothetical protein